MIDPVARNMVPGRPEGAAHGRLHRVQEGNMETTKALVVAGLLSVLVACSKPVPPEKSAYVGDWQGLGMKLLILQDGSVRYERLKSGATTSVSGPLKEFKGDDFVVGVGPITTTFVVSSPPQRDGDRWKMVVDGVALTRRE